MALDQRMADMYTQVLKEELVPAMGCTEPIAIAYAASILRDALGKDPEKVEIGLSGNIIKNVKSVIVPATGGLKGIQASVAAGIVSATPSRKLEVLCILRESDQPRIRAALETIPMQVRKLDTDTAFEIDMTGHAGGDEVRVVLTERHTNVVLVERNGQDITDGYRNMDCNEMKKSYTDRSCLNIQDIIDYAETVPLEGELSELLMRQVQMNMAIAREGLKHNYGACIGKIIYNGGDCSLKDKARAYAAAGSDARMSGCELPVCILSGSGNQGITASVPVIVYADAMMADREQTLRALLVSDLITVHQKTGIGCLSAYCGAISAGCGAGTGICYLNGGRLYEISHTLVNSVAILSGTICDGAKASCASKIAMAVEAGILGYEMMCQGKQFYGGDGIVTKGVENTIRNIGRLARDGMGGTDQEIIRIMLGE